MDIRYWFTVMLGCEVFLDEPIDTLSTGLQLLDLAYKYGAEDIEEPDEGAENDGMAPLWTLCGRPSNQSATSGHLVKCQRHIAIPISRAISRQN